jgi:hypothetical protein
MGFWQTNSQSAGLLNRSPEEEEKGTFFVEHLDPSRLSLLASYRFGCNSLRARLLTGHRA